MKNVEKEEIKKKSDGGPHFFFFFEFNLHALLYTVT